MSIQFDDLGDIPLDELKHYGVKGMKWGVRRSDAQLRSARQNKTQSGKALTAKKVGASTVVTGAATAGSILGGALGTVVLGPGGTGVGRVAGGYIAKRMASKPFEKKHKKAVDEALGDLDKAIPNRNSKYSDGMAKSDIKLWGPESAKRINNSMNEGMSRRKATEKEGNLQFNSNVLAFGTSVASGIAINYGATHMSEIKQAGYKKAYEAGASRAAKRKAAESTLNFAKKNRQGVYNVTTMKR